MKSPLRPGKNEASASRSTSSPSVSRDLASSSALKTRPTPGIEAERRHLFGHRRHAVVGRECEHVTIAPDRGVEVRDERRQRAVETIGWDFRKLATHGTGCAMKAEAVPDACHGRHVLVGRLAEPCSFTDETAQPARPVGAELLDIVGAHLVDDKEDNQFRGGLRAGRHHLWCGNRLGGRRRNAHGCQQAETEWDGG